jgi:single-strand DNA-binding protein
LHNIVALDKQAENISQLLNKGEQLAITGKLINRTYEEEEGKTRFIIEVYLNEFKKLT